MAERVDNGAAGASPGSEDDDKSLIRQLRAENERLRQALAAERGKSHGSRDAATPTAPRGGATEMPAHPLPVVDGDRTSSDTAPAGAGGDAGAGVAASGVRGARRMTNAEIARFSRHMLMPAVGRSGQAKLLSTSVLCVGAGGLGSTVIMYLAAAGVGRLVIVDDDHVDTSNLHRQVIHTTASNGRPKALSARDAALAINPGLECVAVVERFNATNAAALVAASDVVVDATDNLATRYLINDACVLGGKPLVSGAALGFDGQLTVYNYKGGPCYRCLNPKAPPPSGGCSDLGVLGPVPGLIGCYQAIEAIKVACGIGTVMSQKMLIYDALDARCRVVKLRGKIADCAVCSDDPSITCIEDSAGVVSHTCLDATYETDIEAGVTSVTPAEYKAVADSGVPHVLLDVRRPVQFDICRLAGSVNVPYASLAESLPRVRELAGAAAGAGDDVGHAAGTPKPVYVLCRRGIDSVRAAKELQHDTSLGQVFNVAGGYLRWARDVDPEFPTY